MFLARARGQQPPYTRDEILQGFRFTNAYRAADRVSQYLIRDVLYGGGGSSADVVLRALVFRMFNKVETWRLLSDAFGEITHRDFDVQLYSAVLDRAHERGHRIYSSAYIMPPGGPPFESARKHHSHLALIENMMRSGLADRLASASSLREVYELFLTFPMIGPFLAFQFAIDINYSTIVNFSEMDFVVAGPGARSGIRKCFIDSAGFSDADIIRFVTDGQESDLADLGLEFATLWGRPLQLIDVQNLFCEVDKYSRVAHPEVRGLGNRKRIKRRYTPSLQPLTYWFPPKWGINERVDNDLKQVA